MPLIRKIKCTVQSIHDHGSQVYTLGLVPEKEVPLFHPGQFLHLALDTYAPSGFWPDSRAFSIASSPARRDYLQIVYSVQGRFTTRMEKELFIGKNVWVKLPYGEFIIDESEDVALFAGGTGMSAFAAFLESLTPAFQRTVYLFYGARCAQLLLYCIATEKMSHIIPQFHPYYFVEESDGETMPLIQGRLSVTAAWPLIQNPLATTYYLSGPPIMLQTLREDLENRSVRPTSIKIDAWG